MFFRNLTLFRFSSAAAASLDDLETALATRALRHCGPLEIATRGFVSPFGPESQVLTHRARALHLVHAGGRGKAAAGRLAVANGGG